jgi:hypothetical protein
MITIKADKTSSQERPKTKAARFCLQTDSALVAVLLTPPRSRLGRSLPRVSYNRGRNTAPQHCTGAAVQSDSEKDA